MQVSHIQCQDLQHKVTHRQALERLRLTKDDQGPEIADNEDVFDENDGRDTKLTFLIKLICNQHYTDFELQDSEIDLADHLDLSD